MLKKVKVAAMLFYLTVFISRMHMKVFKLLSEDPGGNHVETVLRSREFIGGGD